MKTSLFLLIVLFLASCGTVAPRNNIPPNEWVAFNHKTSYSFQKTGKNSGYLNVKYSSYTFVDKSAENIPIAKSVFKQIANYLARKNGKVSAVYDDSSFYESSAYNGITGVSTVLVSNDVKFVDSYDNSDVQNKSENDDLVNKLENLKRAFDKGLITKKEYENKRKEIIEQY